MTKRHITIPIFIPHLGCTHTCSFCNQWRTSSSAAYPTGETIISTVQSYLKSRANTVEHTEIAFFGGSFTGLSLETQEFFLNTVNPFLTSGEVNSIRVSTRPDYINEKILIFLRNSGVKTIELGVQSFSQEVLDASNRSHSTDDAVQAASMVKEYGFSLVIQLMPGLPKDTTSQALGSVRTAIGCNPDAIRIYPTVVLKDTELEVQYKEGIFSPLTLEEAVELCCDIAIECEKASIPIIRMGLHPVSEEERSAIVAGPYHTALGFLVKARMRRRILSEKVTALIKDAGSVREIDLTIPFTFKEEYIGHKRENISYISDTFNIDSINISYSESLTPGIQKVK